jgi:membrane protein DedA with SNARE-associated domain
MEIYSWFRYDLCLNEAFHDVAYSIGRRMLYVWSNRIQIEALYHERPDHLFYKHGALVVVFFLRDVGFVN